MSNDFVVTSQAEAFTVPNDWTDVPGTTLRGEDISAAFFQVTLAGAACDFRVVQAQFTSQVGRRVIGPYVPVATFATEEVTVGTWPVFVPVYGHRVKVQCKKSSGAPTIFVRGRGLPADVSAAALAEIKALMTPREDTDTLVKLGTLIPLLDAAADVDGTSELIDANTAITTATANVAALNLLGAVLDATFEEVDTAGAITAAKAMADSVQASLVSALSTMGGPASVDADTDAAALDTSLTAGLATLNAIGAKIDATFSEADVPAAAAAVDTQVDDVITAANTLGAKFDAAFSEATADAALTAANTQADDALLALQAAVEGLEPSLTAGATIDAAQAQLDTFEAAFSHGTNGLRAIITARENNGGGSGWPAYVGTIATDTVDDLLAYIATV